MRERGKLVLKEQEVAGTYSFVGVPVYMTQGFKALFQEESVAIIHRAIRLIEETYANRADYLQVLTLDREEILKFWAIHDGEHITFLLPEEY